jgi:hypothetical protein
MSHAFQVRIEISVELNFFYYVPMKHIHRNVFHVNQIIDFVHLVQLKIYPIQSLNRLFKIKIILNLLKIQSLMIY